MRGEQAYHKTEEDSKPERTCYAREEQDHKRLLVCVNEITSQSTPPPRPPCRRCGTLRSGTRTRAGRTTRGASPGCRSRPARWLSRTVRAAAATAHHCTTEHHHDTDYPHRSPSPMTDHHHRLTSPITPTTIHHQLLVLPPITRRHGGVKYTQHSPR